MIGLQFGILKDPYKQPGREAFEGFGFLASFVPGGPKEAELLAYFDDPIRADRRCVDGLCTQLED